MAQFALIFIANPLFKTIKGKCAENSHYMLEITNITLELYNKTYFAMKSKEYMKVVFLICGSFSAIAGVFVWLRSPDREINATELAMIVGVILLVVFALFLGFSRLRSVKQELPAEDEMSKKILRKGASTSYYLSLYLWLVLMMFSDMIKLETRTMIGAGIMGMAVLYALSWIYHRYFSLKHD